MAEFGGSCIWPVTYPGDDCEAFGSNQQDFESMAAEYLWNWTGRQFGLCEVTVRPVVDCDRVATYRGRGPYSFSGIDDGGYTMVVPWVCGVHRFNGCNCSESVALYLSDRVEYLSSVTVNGVDLAPDAYRLDNHHTIIRTDGGVWPSEQDFTADTTEDGTWSITYSAGTPVPPGGQIAAGILACELAKAAVDDSTCRLPKRVQTITRQGVSMGFLDSFEDIDKGHTGIWLIDSWIASVSKSPRGGAVINPDTWLSDSGKNFVVK